MNTLLSQIVADAYRESNITNLGGTLTTAQQDEGLRLLQRVIASVYGFEAGDQLTPLPLGNNTVSVPSGYPVAFPVASEFIPLNTRLILNLTAATTVYLHPDPEDGSMFSYVDENSTPFDLTVNANGRRIEGAATYNTTTALSNRQWLYDAPTGQWNVISPLALTDLMPFPPEFDDLFIISLAMRLNPRYTVTLAGESVARMKDILRKFKARYNQTIQTSPELALIFTPNIRSQRGYYWGAGYGTSTDIFNRGYPYIG